MESGLKWIKEKKRVWLTRCKAIFVMIRIEGDEEINGRKRYIFTVKNGWKIG
jgi:hypothetical protein